MNPTHSIQIKNLDFSYGSIPVLEQVDLTLGEREFVCVIGPNGGGKTTLLKLLLGLLKPQTGTVSIFGKPPAAGRKSIGYLPQHANLDPRFPVTALDVVLMGRLGKTRGVGFYTSTDKRIARDMLARVGIDTLETRSMAELSGGQRQRVLIARALVSEPKLLLLDEPTSSLDGYVEREFYDLLQELNQELAIMVVTHDIGFVSGHVGKVVCVNRQVRVHPTSKIDPNTIRDMYGENVHLVRHDREHGDG